MRYSQPAAHQSTSYAAPGLRSLLSRSFWALSDVYSAGGLVYLILKTLFGEGLWPVALVNNLASWLLLPALPLLALAAVQKRWRHAVPLAIISAGFVWLFGELFVPRNPPQTACASPADGCVVRLRVMSFNLLNDESDTERVIAEIRKADADIVGLIEYSRRKAAAVEAELGNVYPYHVQHEDDIPGIGLLSKYPILEEENFLIAHPVLSHLRAVVSIDGVPLTIYVAHPSPPAFSPRYTARGSVDITELARRASSGGPTLLLGDFNMADISDDYQVVAGTGLVDAFREAGFGVGPTWPVRRWNMTLPPLVRIDYVWHTWHFSATRAWVGGETGSDHLPVIADLVWRDEQK